MNHRREKRQQLRRAMFLADLGLILALLIVLYALSQDWVKPTSPEPSPQAGWGEVTPAFSEMIV